jgi:hypothetical protein
LEISHENETTYDILEDSRTEGPDLDDKIAIAISNLAAEVCRWQTTIEELRSATPVNTYNPNISAPLQQFKTSIAQAGYRVDKILKARKMRFRIDSGHNEIVLTEEEENASQVLDTLQGLLRACEETSNKAPLGDVRGFEKMKLKLQHVQVYLAKDKVKTTS